MVCAVLSGRRKGVQCQASLLDRQRCGLAATVCPARTRKGHVRGGEVRVSETSGCISMEEAHVHSRRERMKMAIPPPAKEPCMINWGEYEPCSRRVPLTWPHHRTNPLVFLHLPGHIRQGCSWTPSAHGHHSTLQRGSPAPRVIRPLTAFSVLHCLHLSPSPLNGGRRRPRRGARLALTPLHTPPSRFFIDYERRRQAAPITHPLAWGFLQSLLT